MSDPCLELSDGSGLLALSDQSGCLLISGAVVATEVSGGAWLPQPVSKKEMARIKKIREEVEAKIRRERTQKAEEKRELARELEIIFNRINGIEEVSDELEEIVEPFVAIEEKNQGKSNRLPRIDFEALAVQAEIANRLRDLAFRIEQQRMEDDAIALLLLVS